MNEQIYIVLGTVLGFILGWVLSKFHYSVRK